MQVYYAKAPNLTHSQCDLSSHRCCLVHIDGLSFSLSVVFDAQMWLHAFSSLDSCTRRCVHAHYDAPLQCSEYHALGMYATLASFGCCLICLNLLCCRPCTNRGLSAALMLLRARSGAHQSKHSNTFLFKSSHLLAVTSKVGNL